MKAKKTYLKGKSVFIVSLVVIGITILTVYLTGENYNRTVTSNLYLSLSIKGIGLRDNFPKFREFKTGELISSSGEFPNIDMPSIDTDDGISGVIISVLLWIAMTILFFVLLLLLEALFWISIFIVFAMLYWVFFRALKLVFSKYKETKGAIGISVVYAFGYTALYVGWIFGIVYVAEVVR